MMAMFFVFILSSATNSTATFVTAFRTDFHKTFGMRQRLEAELGIKPVRVPRSQHEPPQPLQPGMRQQCGHKFLADTLPPFLLDNENVGKPRERRIIGDDTREADLLPVQINS